MSNTTWESIYENVEGKRRLRDGRYANLLAITGTGQVR